MAATPHDARFTSDSRYD